MATATKICTKWMKAQAQSGTGGCLNIASDTIKMMAIVAGTGAPNLTSSGVQFVSDVTSGNSEDTLIGPRKTLSGITWANDASVGGSVDWSFSTAQYAQSATDDSSTRYFVIYDDTGSTGDAQRAVMFLLDPGQSVSVVNGTLTIAAPAGGLMQYTGGG